MRLGKKGFSLVELVISLAIFSIVGATVSAFIVTGNNSYVRGNNDLTLQEEAQLVTNQLIDLIIDVQDKIVFADGITGEMVGNDGGVLMGAEAQNADIKQLLIYNENVTYMVRWQDGTGDYANKIFLYQEANTVDADGNTVYGFAANTGSNADKAPAGGALLAEYVKSFDVSWTPDADGNPKDRKVVLKMEFEYQNNKYSVNETIKLRNSFNKDNVTYQWIEKIIVYPITPKTGTTNVAEIYCGDSAGFRVEFIGDPEAVKIAKNSNITYTVKKVDDTEPDSEHNMHTTYIEPSTGVMHVDNNEVIGDARFEVYASSSAFTSGSIVCEPAIVNILDIPFQGIEIGDDVIVKPGDEHMFTAEIKGGAKHKKDGVTWTFEPVSPNTFASGTVGQDIAGDASFPNRQYKISVSGSQPLGMKVFKVTATANCSTNTAINSDTVYVSVLKYSADIIRTDLRVEKNMGSDGNWDGTVSYVADLEFLPEWADYTSGQYPKIYWGFQDSAVAGAYDLSATDKHPDVYSNPDSNYNATLNCKKEHDTSVTIKVWGELAAGMPFLNYVTIDIPKLEGTTEMNKPYISGNFVLDRQGVNKLTLVIPENEKNKESQNSGDDEDEGGTEPVEVRWRIDWDDSAATDRYTETDSHFIGMSKADKYNELRNTDAARWDASLKRDLVGFGYAKDNNGSYTETAEPHVRQAHLLEREGYGETTYIRAQWYINPNTEYKLKVIASVNKGDDEEEKWEDMAWTYVLIPKFEIKFPDNTHVAEVDVGEWGKSNQQLHMITYGYEMRNQQDSGAFTDPGVNKSQAEIELSVSVDAEGAFNYYEHQTVLRNVGDFTVAYGSLGRSQGNTHNTVMLFFKDDSWWGTGAERMLMLALKPDYVAPH